MTLTLEETQFVLGLLQGEPVEYSESKLATALEDKLRHRLDAVEDSDNVKPTEALFSEEYDELNLDALSEDPRPNHEIAEDFVRWDVEDALESGWPISETGEEMYLCGYYNATTQDIHFFPDPVKR